MMLKVLSLFSGIGAFEKALTELKIDYELVGFSEVDKHAIKAYTAIHGVDEKLNLGDIKKIDANKLEDFNLLVLGFPCQDLSPVGMRKGFKGEKSSLYKYAFEILKNKKPDFIVIENVKDLILFFSDYKKIVSDLMGLGYRVRSFILNAVNYGIPQGRVRLFIIACKDKIIYNIKQSHKESYFYELLEKNVSDKYFLSARRIESLKRRAKTGRKVKFKKRSEAVIARTLTTSARQFNNNFIIEEDERIRQLTPLECFRLMGWSDEDFYKIRPFTSDHQLYRMSGNSIVVPVLKSIFKELLK